MFDPERGAWAKELKEDDALLHLTKAEANNMVARWACRRYIYMITVRSRPIDDTDLRAMILLHCFLLPGAMDWDPLHNHLPPRHTACLRNTHCMHCTPRLSARSGQSSTA